MVTKVDPLKCPHCGGQMKIISFIERHQQDVIERILRHCGLWEGPIRTLANPRAPPSRAGRAAGSACDLELVPDAEFLESQRLDNRPEYLSAQPCELPLVLDPDYR